MRGARVLLAAVMAMGVLILIGTAVLIGTVVHRATHRSDRAGLPVGAPTTLSLQQPVGTRIASVTRQSDRLLAVTLSGGGLPDRLLLWDTLAQRIVATLQPSR